jgi:hypothetical protein
MALPSVGTCHRQPAVAAIEDQDLRRDSLRRASVIKNIIGSGEPLPTIELCCHDQRAPPQARAAARNDATDLFLFRAVDDEDPVDSDRTPLRSSNSGTTITP